MAENDDMYPSEVDRAESILRTIGEDDLSVMTPPSSVWRGIEDELGLESEDADVIDLSSRRRTPFLVVAAACLVVVAMVGIVFVDSGSDDTVVASAVLIHDDATFDEAGAGSSAEVTLVDDGSALVLRVDSADLPAVEDEDLELWLIRPDESGEVAGIVSLGLIDPDDPGSYDVPPDVDTGEFVVVDISVEPRDGIPTHSGRSIVRGPFVSA